MRHALLLLMMLTTSFVGPRLFYSDRFAFGKFLVAAPFSCDSGITDSGFVV
jgi:hypothetical protein